MSESTSPMHPIRPTSPPPTHAPPQSASAGAAVGAGVARPAPRQPPNSGPRKIREGVKVRLRSPDQAEHWISQRWLEVVWGLWPADVIAKGWEYARLGQVISPRIETGGIMAAVQGTAHRPYVTGLGVLSLSAETQQQLATRMSQRASLVASVISGELPGRDLLEDLLVESRFWMFQPLPPVGGGFVRCSCRSMSERGVCHHVAALGLHVLDWLNRDPLVVFELHGVDRTRLIDQLRHARTMQTQGGAGAVAQAVVLPSRLQRPPEPLESSIDEFWRCGSTWPAVREMQLPSYAPLALLRRLGPSPLGGRFPLVGLLESILSAVANDAQAMREASEGLPVQESSSRV